VQGHDAAALYLAVDWTPIVVALITLSGVVFNGLLGLYIVRHVRTPSKKPLGAQVEDALQVALGNNYRLRLLLGETPLPPDGDDG
jgi:hypothetical protein